MIRRWFPGLLALAGLLAALATVAVAAAETGLPWSVFGGGGGTASSTNYTLGGTIGQPVAVPAQSANYGLNAGYWYVADTDADGLFDEIDLEDDGDGYTDTAEAGQPLCLNATNEDTFDDAVANDGCQGGPAKVGAYSEAQFKIGTGAADPCGVDGWPSNAFDGGLSANKLDVQDIISFVAPARRLDTSPLSANFNMRWDLAPGPNSPFPNYINIIDITTLLNGVPGSPAYPPMLIGQRAFGKVCPSPP